MRDVERFRQQLEAEQDRLCHQVTWIKEESLPQDETVQEAMPQSGDDEIADAATGTYTQELDAALLRRARNQLAAVTSALERLEIGRFGLCVNCGKEIAQGRLEALPWAPYCMSCAQELEVLD